MSSFRAALTNQLVINIMNDKETILNKTFLYCSFLNKCKISLEIIHILRVYT